MKRLLACLLFVTACATDAKPPIDDDFTDLASLGAKSDAFSAKMRILGDLTYGQTVGAISYNNKPKYLAYTFTGNVGDMVTADVVSQDGKSDPVAWILDGSFHILAKNDDAGPGTSNSHVAVTLPASTTAVHYVVFREITDESGVFQVTLNGQGTPPPTSCMLTAAPTTGDLDTTFNVDLETRNASTCVVNVDSFTNISVPCSGAFGVSAAALGVGSHDLGVVATGPQGQIGSCDTILAITALPTCASTITPAAGAVSDGYQFDTNAQNATLCSFSIDGGPAQDVPCNGSLAAFGSFWGGAGVHVISVTATDANGSIGTCSTTVTESP